MWHFWCLMTQRVSVKSSSVTLRHITSICFDNHWWGSDRVQGNWHEWESLVNVFHVCVFMHAGTSTQPLFIIPFLETIFYFGGYKSIILCALFILISWGYILINICFWIKRFFMYNMHIENYKDEYTAFTSWILYMSTTWSRNKILLATQ